MANFSFISGIWINAFLINFLLIFLGHRLPFLTKNGWIHAGILGTLLLGSIGWNGWIAVCVYLLLGTLVTKIGYKNKASRGIAEARGGQRGPENVWGSAATGCSLALLSCFWPNFLNLLFSALYIFKSCIIFLLLKLKVPILPLIFPLNEKSFIEFIFPFFFHT